MWKIIYRDIQGNKEFSIDNQEYEEIVKFLNKPKMIRLKSGIVLNMSFIKLIEPLPEQQVISKEFRLPEVGESTAGKELRKINITEGMERLFNKLKSVGLFRDYKNYTQYTNRKI